MTAIQSKSFDLQHVDKLVVRQNLQKIVHSSECGTLRIKLSNI